MRFGIFVFLFFFIFLSSFAYANVIITEIMYDVEGADIGREWIEIKNEGLEIDLTSWKFFENGINHGLILEQGGASLLQNGFAIIADSAEKFLLDWPGFAGTLFDSSFSLSNTGETMVLRDAGLKDNDSATYSSGVGAAGDGNSLQKIDNEWIAFIPTPGLENSKVEIENTLEVPPNVEVVNSGRVPEPKPAPFSVYAGEDRLVLAGAEVYFEGQVKGVEENMVEKTRFLWNFGDGTIGEGKNIKHIFQYPGTYVINLDVSFGAYSSSDSVKVGVWPAGMSISEIKPGEFVEIKNDSTKISDVSGFGIAINDSKIFSFSKDSKLAASSFLTLDSLTLGLEIPDSGEIKILYPNGKVLVSSKYASSFLQQKESISFDNGAWKKSEVTPGVKNIIKKPLSAEADSSKENTQNSFSTQSQTISPLIKGGGEASVINSQSGASFWSEIKWLIFGLGAGIIAGLIFLLLRRHFK